MQMFISVRYTAAAATEISPSAQIWSRSEAASLAQPATRWQPCRAGLQDGAR